MKKILLFLCSSLLAVSLQAQTIRYVKQGGTGDGTSWAQASGDLQAMINASSSGNQVWVATGAYQRNQGDGNSFIMKEGVQVFGGFPNTGNPTMANRTLPTAQTPANHTILNGQKYLRVLYQPAAFATLTTWDGFVIEYGKREPASADPNLRGNGAGAYLQANGELKNCVVRANNIINW